MGYFDPILASVSFRSFFRRLGAGPVPEPPVASAVVPIARVMNDYAEDEVRLWGMTTVITSLTAGHFGSCGLLSGATSLGARNSVRIWNIEAWAAKASDGSGILSSGFYLYTPEGAYLNRPDPNGGFGATPTLFKPGLVMGTPNYAEPESSGISGQTATQLPQSPFTSYLKIVPVQFVQSVFGNNTANGYAFTNIGGVNIPDYVYTSTVLTSAFSVPSPITLWSQADRPLVLLRDQIIGVQLSFAPASTWTMFVSWVFSEHQTEGA